MSVVTSRAAADLARLHPTDADLPTPLQLPHLHALVRAQRGETDAWLAVRQEYRSARDEAERAQLAYAGRSPGRPPLRSAASDEVRLAAWLADGCGRSNQAIVRLLGLGGQDDRSARRTAARYVQQGRTLLNDLGVLPWTLWVDGRVEPRWWTSERFTLAFAIWCAELRAKGPVLDSLRDMWAAAISHARAQGAVARRSVAHPGSGLVGPPSDDRLSTEPPPHPSPRSRGTRSPRQGGLVDDLTPPPSDRPRSKRADSMAGDAESDEEV